MKAQKAQNDPQKVLEEMERERKEMEEMFTIKAGEAEKLREKDVLSNAWLGIFFRPLDTDCSSINFLFFYSLGAMQSVIEEEMKREMLRVQYEAGRKDVINNALSM